MRNTEEPEKEEIQKNKNIDVIEQVKIIICIDSM